MTVAQTNIQLYNQLLARGFDRDQLVLVRRAYELLQTLYAGFYQADGKPFVAHGVGVASIMADLGEPADIVATALLHGVYANADFGDGLPSGATPRRRRIVRDAVGGEIEALVHRFTNLRLHPETIERDRRELDELDQTGRRLQLLAVADHLEKYVDLGVRYFGDDRDIASWTERIGPQLVEIAGELAGPEFARAVASAFERAEAANVPAELRASDGAEELKLVVPRSCRRRRGPRLRRRVR
jgi:(p)ppGpp synthase/HD superfamily hydrolase